MPSRCGASLRHRRLSEPSSRSFERASTISGRVRLIRGGVGGSTLRPLLGSDTDTRSHMQGAHLDRARVFARLALSGATMALVAAAALPIAAAHATAQSGTLSMVASTASPAVGDTISVTFNVSGGDHVHAVRLAVAYNASVLQVVDYDAGASGIQIAPGVFPGGDSAGTVLQNSASGGVISYQYALAGANETAGSGTVATVQFQAIANGNAGLTWNTAQIIDAGSSAVSVNNSAATIVVGGVAAAATNTVAPIASGTPAATDTPAATSTPTQDAASATASPTVAATGTPDATATFATTGTATATAHTSSDEHAGRDRDAAADRGPEQQWRDADRTPARRAAAAVRAGRLGERAAECGERRSAHAIVEMDILRCRLDACRRRLVLHVCASCRRPAHRAPRPPRPETPPPVLAIARHASASVAGARAPRRGHSRTPMHRR